MPICEHTNSASTHAWCTECGGPLGALEAQCTSGPLDLDGATVATATIQLKNKGKGKLYAGFDPNQDAGVALPPGLSTGYIPLDAAGKPHETRVMVYRDRLPKGKQRIVVRVWALDGARSDEGSPLEARREYQIPVDLRWIERRPPKLPDVIIFCPSALPSNLWRRKVPIYNPSNVEERVHLSGRECLLSVGEEVGLSTLDLVIPARTLIEVQVTVNAAFTNGSISVTSEGGGTHTVDLYKKPVERRDPPWASHTAGMDFGTSKSAVFTVDNWNKALHEIVAPTPVLWKKPRGKDLTATDEWYIPSAVRYPPGSATQYGWDLPTGTDIYTVRDIKSLVRLGKRLNNLNIPPSKDPINDFLRYLWDRTLGTLRQRDENLEPETVQVVLAMPVGENDEHHEEQKQRTREAATNAFGFNIRIEMMREPECAATDFILQGARWGFIPAKGNYVLIFDCGAGTTDISIIRIEEESDGNKMFKIVGQTGFEFAGNKIDERITRLLLDQGIVKGLPIKQVDEHNYLIDTVPFKFEEICEAVRVAKEQLFFPSSPGDVVPAIPIGVDYAGLEVSWSLVNEAVAPFMQEILNGTSPASDPKITTLPELISRCGLNRSDITWLCLTGGSVLIPEIVDSLQWFFSGGRLRLVPPREKLPEISRDPDRPLTKNVARGAASVLEVRMPETLGYHVSLVLEQGTETDIREDVLTEDATPGTAKPFRPFTLAEHQDGLLYVKAKRQGKQGDEETIYVHHIPPRDTRRTLGNIIRFTTNREILLTLGRDTEIVVG